MECVNTRRRHKIVDIIIYERSEQEEEIKRELEIGGQLNDIYKAFRCGSTEKNVNMCVSVSMVNAI